MPTEKDVVRVKTFINTVMISQDEENFYFNTLNQVDFKVIKIKYNYLFTKNFLYCFLDAYSSKYY